jgi:hypothetical protein
LPAGQFRIQVSVFGGHFGFGDGGDLILGQLFRQDGPAIASRKPTESIRRQYNKAIVAVLGDRDRFDQRTIGDRAVVLDEYGASMNG